MGLFFIIIAGLFLIIFGLSCYVLSFIFEGKNLRRSRIALAILDLGLIAGTIFHPEILRESTFPVSFLSVMLVWQFFSIIFILTAAAIRSIYRHLPSSDKKFDPERRRLIRNAIFYPFLSFAIGLYGNNVERKRTVDRNFDIPIDNLPPELENFTIAQISDIHLGKYFSLEDLSELLTRVANSQPDLLAITGDIFDDISMNSQAIKLVDSFCDKFKLGIWYCHGNHEHHRGIRPIELGLAQTRIHWLVNQWESAGISNLTLIGVDYPMVFGDNEKFQKLKHEFIAEAMQGIPENSTKILLAHHPEFIDDAREFQIPLTMTGHTHGSQIGIFGLPLFPVFKYTRGMVIDKSKKFFGYVHVGNGSWFPFRFGCPPEIAYFHLRRQNS